jgi:Skp family chaperone for outer membrane proteins
MNIMSGAVVFPSREPEMIAPERRMSLQQVTAKVQDHLGQLFEDNEFEIRFRLPGRLPVAANSQLTALQLSAQGGYVEARSLGVPGYLPVTNVREMLAEMKALHQAELLTQEEQRKPAATSSLTTSFEAQERSSLQAQLDETRTSFETRLAERLAEMAASFETRLAERLAETAASFETRLAERSAETAASFQTQLSSVVNRLSRLEVQNARLVVRQLLITAHGMTDHAQLSGVAVNLIGSRFHLHLNEAAHPRLNRLEVEEAISIVADANWSLKALQEISEFVFRGQQ